MAMMINQRLKDNQVTFQSRTVLFYRGSSKDTDDGDLERIDLDALKRLESPRKVNPLQPHREEDHIKPPEK